MFYISLKYFLNILFQRVRSNWPFAVAVSLPLSSFFLSFELYVYVYSNHVVAGYVGFANLINVNVKCKLFAHTSITAVKYGMRLAKHDQNDFKNCKIELLDLSWIWVMTQIMLLHVLCELYWEPLKTWENHIVGVCSFGSPPLNSCSKICSPPLNWCWKIMTHPFRKAKDTSVPFFCCQIILCYNTQ